MSQTRADGARGRRCRRRRVRRGTGKREIRIDRFGKLLLFTI